MKPLAFVIDLLLVLAFVLIGRASHDENPVLGALVTLWPFAAGLVVGWAVSRAWRAPLNVVRSGIPIWITTVVIGMLLRVASSQGVKPSFVVVATIVLAIFLLGWRAIVALVHRLRRRSALRRR
ncbi:DUF3054 domain-containing protein [soil metagenome]